MESMSGEELLERYSQDWSHYVKSTKTVNDIFAYLNQYWIKRNHDEGGSAVPIKKTRLDTGLLNQIMQAVFEQITQLRCNQGIRENLIKSVAESFVSLGVERHMEVETKDFYERKFEQPFLRETSTFYNRKTKDLSTTTKVLDYMKEVEFILGRENLLADKLLHPDSKEKLLHTIVEVLIEQPQESFREVFDNLLEEKRETELLRLYNLLVRIKDGLLPLREKFRARIFAVGTETISNIDKSLKPQQYAEVFVRDSLRIYEEYHSLFESSFKNNVPGHSDYGKQDSGFSEALSQGVASFINSTALLPPSEDSPDKRNEMAQRKAAELISVYCDHLLKKGSKISETDRIHAITPVLSISKFLAARDFFLEKYRQSLSRRLISNNYESIDFEKIVLGLSGLSEEKQAVTNLQSMLNDVQMSIELSETFNSLNRQKPGFEFSFRILTKGKWPLKAEKSSLQLPPSLAQTWQHVPKYYDGKHVNRILNPLWKFSKVHIVPTYLNTPVKKGQYLMVSTLQYAVLGLFEDKTESLTWEAIAERTLDVSQKDDAQTVKSHAEVIKATLATLVHTGAMLVVPNDAQPGPGASYRLNLDFKFKPKQRVVNLDIQLKADRKREDVEADERVEEDRKHLIQAAI
ncbi:ubiquitin ligase (cullin) of SCF, partial [Spiromyces aspiralis]